MILWGLIFVFAGFLRFIECILLSQCGLWDLRRNYENLIHSIGMCCMYLLGSYTSFVDLIHNICIGCFLGLYADCMDFMVYVLFTAKEGNMLVETYHVGCSCSCYGILEQIESIASRAW